MKKLIDADSLKAKIMGEPPEARYPVWYAAMVDEEPDASIVGLETLDALVQAAYKAGKEGKPLMVALNEEVTT
jgi:hypothetical protein